MGMIWQGMKLSWGWFGRGGNGKGWKGRGGNCHRDDLTGDHLAGDELFPGWFRRDKSSGMKWTRTSLTLSVAGKGCLPLFAILSLFGRKPLFGETQKEILHLPRLEESNAFRAPHSRHQYYMCLCDTIYNDTIWPRNHTKQLYVLNVLKGQKN